MPKRSQLIVWKDKNEKDLLSYDGAETVATIRVARADVEGLMELGEAIAEAVQLMREAAKRQAGTQAPK